MRVFLFALIVCVASEASAQSWSWPDGDGASSSRGGRGGGGGGGEGSSRKVSTSGGRQRYEVFESGSDDFTLPHPEDLINRPLPRPPPGPGPGLGPVRPQSPGPVRPNYPLLNPNPGFRPPYPASDLHGPSRCKCSQPFNCEANSLQFGSCDAGKQYCCTKDARGPRGPRPGGVGGPEGPFERPAILVGPGGPQGVAPSKGGEYGSGVLTGPQPAYYRPDPAAGFSSRPGPGAGTGTGVSPGFYNHNGRYRDYDNYNRKGFGLNQ